MGLFSKKTEPAPYPDIVTIIDADLTPEQIDAAEKDRVAEQQAIGSDSAEGQSIDAEIMASGAELIDAEADIVSIFHPVTILDVAKEHQEAALKRRSAAKQRRERAINNAAAFERSRNGLPERQQRLNAFSRALNRAKQRAAAKALAKRFVNHCRDGLALQSEHDKQLRENPEFAIDFGYPTGIFSGLDAGVGVGIKSVARHHVLQRIYERFPDLLSAEDTAAAVAIATRPVKWHAIHGQRWSHLPIPRQGSGVGGQIV